MEFNSNGTKSYMKVSLLLCTVFVLHLIITPVAYAQGLNLIPTMKRTSPSTRHNKPYRQAGEHYLISEFSGNEILTGVEVNHIISRNLHEFQRLLRTILNISTIAFTCFGVLLFGLHYSTKKKTQRIPVIAMSIGGHDPPQVFI